MDQFPETQPFEQALTHARLRPDEAVLDLSGRAGTVALRIAPEVLSVEAVQPQEELAEEGRRLAAALGTHNVYFHAGPLNSLPFDRAQFGLALWLLSLSSEPQPLRTLGEIARVLKPGGRLVLQDVVSFEVPALDLKLGEMERCRNPRHLLFYNPQEIQTLIDLAGLHIESTGRASLTQDFDYWLDPLSLKAEEALALKQSFFLMNPAEQDLIDLSLTDRKISFSQRILTVTATA